MDVAQRILVIRGQKAMLDADLAGLYAVPTKVLLQAVRRNLNRFPLDFAFQPTNQEFRGLRSQFVTSSQGGRRHAPYAFSEQGVAMLSSVLNSPRANAVNIEIMRTFVRLREAPASNSTLAAKFGELERKIDTHDQAISGILSAIRHLMAPAPASGRPIGFVTPAEKRHA